MIDPDLPEQLLKPPGPGVLSPAAVPAGAGDFSGFLRVGQIIPDLVYQVFRRGIPHNLLVVPEKPFHFGKVFGEYQPSRGGGFEYADLDVGITFDRAREVDQHLRRIGRSEPILAVDRSGAVFGEGPGIAVQFGVEVFHQFPGQGVPVLSAVGNHRHIAFETGLDRPSPKEPFIDAKGKIMDVPMTPLLIPPIGEQRIGGVPGEMVGVTGYRREDVGVAQRDPQDRDPPFLQPQEIHFGKGVAAGITDDQMGTKPHQPTSDPAQTDIDGSVSAQTSVRVVYPFGVGPQIPFLDDVSRFFKGKKHAADDVGFTLCVTAEMSNSHRFLYPLKQKWDICFSLILRRNT